MTNEELQAEVDRLRRVILDIQNRTMEAMGAVMPGTLTRSCTSCGVKMLPELSLCGACASRGKTP